MVVIYRGGQYGHFNFPWIVPPKSSSRQISYWSANDRRSDGCRIPGDEQETNDLSLDLLRADSRSCHTQLAFKRHLHF
jgi:hypothetical protein